LEGEFDLNKFLFWRFSLIYIFIFLSGICVGFKDFEVDPKLTAQIDANYTKSLRCLFDNPKGRCP